MPSELEGPEASSHQKQHALRQILADARNSNLADSAVVVDGKSLQVFLDGEHKCWMEFQEVAVLCSSVIVCRVSPDQKAQAIPLLRYVLLL